MAARSYAQVAPTAATIALNAYIYGYGGHSLVTPHAALKQLWWTDERIEGKITRAFVVSKLRGEERDFLDRPLAFGEGLTDDTYMEWILERAKRLFLILTEVGVPDQIFGCIDDSWDDDDLPISLENIKNLELSSEDDPALDRRFYDLQFVYLLRELKKNSHIDYSPKEHIPMEHTNKLPPAVTLQPYDRIHFPDREDEVYMRRKYSFPERGKDKAGRDVFLRDVRQAKLLSHEHIASTWATYTAKDAGFILSDFVPEHTLATFIEHRTAAQFLRVPALKRPVLLMEWMHCLSDALASLHHRGAAHSQIRPSNIWIDGDNRIAFADVGSIATYQRGKKIPKTEDYDYAAPEQQISRIPVKMKSSPLPPSSLSAFSKLRLMTHSISDASSSSSGSSGGSSTRSNSMSTLSPISPVTPPIGGRTSSFSTISSPISPINTTARNFSRQMITTTPVCPSPNIGSSRGSGPPLSPLSLSSAAFQLPQNSTSIDLDSLRDLPPCTPQMSDVYSLACTFLDILTFVLKGKIGDFVKFRSSKVAAVHPSQAHLTSNPSTAAAGGGGGGGRTRTDTSFHSSPDKIHAWTSILEEDSFRHGAQVFRGIPDLLRLIRTMLAQNASVRPSALEVRDRLEEILRDQCGVHQGHPGGRRLCCERRGWDQPEVEMEIGSGDGSGRIANNSDSEDADNEDADGQETQTPLRRWESPGAADTAIGMGMNMNMSHDSAALAIALPRPQAPYAGPVASSSSSSAASASRAAPTRRRFASRAAAAVTSAPTADLETYDQPYSGEFSRPGTAMTARAGAGAAGPPTRPLSSASTTKTTASRLGSWRTRLLRSN